MFRIVFGAWPIRGPGGQFWYCSREGCWLGCPGFTKKLTKIWSKIYVIIKGTIMHYLNFQSFPTPFTIWKLHLKYTKEILKNTKEIIGQRDF